MRVLLDLGEQILRRQRCPFRPNSDQEARTGAPSNEGRRAKKDLPTSAFILLDGEFEKVAVEYERIECALDPHPRLIRVAGKTCQQVMDRSD
jgi:hypothetical protein